MARSNILSIQRPQVEDDVLATAGDCPVLIEAVQVEAACTALKKHFYGPYKQEKFVFDFAIISPQEYEGTVVQMFVRTNPSWTNPPPSSKLYKIACIAEGRQLRKGQSITKSMFKNKVFRCRLKRSGDGAAAYTTVDVILEKITG